MATEPIIKVDFNQKEEADTDNTSGSKKRKLVRFQKNPENWGPQAKPGNKTATGKVPIKLYETPQ